jgi:phosphatidylglycerol---prolipoprotein diacylglyceryl transferase
MIHLLDPVLLSLGPIQIRWYGLIYALGFILGYFILIKLAEEKKLKLSKEDIGDLVFYLILCIVAGARIFYILFYNLGYYLSSPLEMLALWHGGLSFHGGFVGAIVAISLFSKKKKLHFYEVSDMVVVPAALALALGRIGNFINGELYGRAASVSWCVDYSQNPHMTEQVVGCRHPSQLYESLYSFVMFSVLYLLNKKNLPRGVLTWSFVALYGLFRTLAELFRQPDAQVGFLFGGLTMGQLLSIPMLILGSYMVWRISK